MRLHRFYLGNMQGELVVGKDVHIADSAVVHQIKKVFRLASGDKVVLFDGSGFDFVSSIGNAEAEKFTVRVEEKIKSRFIPEMNFHFFIAITKKDNFEWALLKCTELGVGEFTPVVSERTEKKNINLERAEIIIKEASEQSGRGDVPKLNPSVGFKEMLETFGKELVVLHTDAEKFSDENFSAKYTHFAIGPEGGFSEKEINLAKEADAKIISLGEQVLRAETASVSLASLLLLR